MDGLNRSDKLFSVFGGAFLSRLQASETALVDKKPSDNASQNDSERLDEFAIHNMAVSP